MSDIITINVTQTVQTVDIDVVGNAVTVNVNVNPTNQNVKQLMFDADITPDTATTLLATSVDITVNRTITLPTISAFAITVIDEQQTIYKDATTNKYITITVENGKTLNGELNGYVYLGKKGQSITFYHDGNGNYTYAVPEKRFIWYFEMDNTDSIANQRVIQNTTQTILKTLTDNNDGSFFFSEYNPNTMLLSSIQKDAITYNIFGSLKYSDGVIYAYEKMHLLEPKIFRDGGYLIIEEI